MRPDRLPSLHALRAFEAVGRRLSFSLAAEELHVSQSAVSHHIRNLERDLGVPLFVRHARTVELTDTGERFFRIISQAFDLMRQGTGGIRSDGSRIPLRISLTPSFATNWLASRLPRFAHAHPDIDIRLDPTLHTVDLAAGEADLAIRYGQGDWGSVRRRLLMAERLTPVCSPALLEEGPPIREPADLLHHTLLLNKRPHDWTLWAEAYGLDLSKARTIMLTDYNVVLQAALEGTGIAMGRLVLIGGHVHAGRLTAPLADTVRTPPDFGHWLLLPRGRISPAAAVFVDWIGAEAGI